MIGMNSGPEITAERNPRQHLWRAGIALFLIVLGCMTVYRGAIRSVKLVDSTVYLAAGESVLHGGEDLYRVTDERGLHYIYPPVFAIVFAPMAMLPPAVAVALWYLITIALLAAGLRAVLAVSTPAGKPLDARLLALPLLVCADPILGAITRGQVSILMFACVALALAWRARGRAFQSGFLIGFVTVMKLYPGLLVFYFLVRRDWRALAGVVSAALLFGALLPALVFGPTLAVGHWTYWFTEIVAPFNGAPDPSSPLFHELTNPDFVNNASLSATVLHAASLLPGASTPAARHWIQTAARVLGVLIVIALPLVWRREKPELKHYALVFEWSVAALIGLVVVPVAWIHYFCMLLLPLTAIACYLRYEAPGPTARWLRMGVTAVVILTAVFVLTSIVRGPLEGSPARAVVMTIRSLGAYCWSTLLLAGVFSYILTGRSNLKQPSAQPASTGGRL
jgi:hypothetical protein